MTGEEYIALAGRLVVSPALGSEEARFRTAASRAYYGAFHLAVALLTSWGIKVRQNAYGHQDAYNLFWGSDHSEARKVASLLDDLRTERIKADYRLDDPRFHDPPTAMMCVEMGEAVKRCLDRCRHDAETVQQGIQQWRILSGR